MGTREKDGVFRAIVADGKIVGNISVEQKSDVYCKDGEMTPAVLAEKLGISDRAISK